VRRVGGCEIVQSQRSYAHPRPSKSPVAFLRNLLRWTRAPHVGETTVVLRPCRVGPQQAVQPIGEVHAIGEAANACLGPLTTVEGYSIGRVPPVVRGPDPGNRLAGLQPLLVDERRLARSSRWLLPELHECGDTIEHPRSNVVSRLTDSTAARYLTVTCGSHEVVYETQPCSAGQHALGLSLSSQPTMRLGGYAGYFHDPDGHLWKVFSRPGARTVAPPRSLPCAPRPQAIVRCHELELRRTPLGRHERGGELHCTGSAERVYAQEPNGRFTHAFAGIHLVPAIGEAAQPIELQ
jgi:hypothetical protein